MTANRTEAESNCHPTRCWSIRKTHRNRLIQNVLASWLDRFRNTLFSVLFVLVAVDASRAFAEEFKVTLFEDEFSAATLDKKWGSWKSLSMPFLL